LPLRSLKLAISVRRKKLLGRLCKQPRGGATPLWPTRFGMKSHFMSSACRITSKSLAFRACIDAIAERMIKSSTLLARECNGLQPKAMKTGAD
jgi:hypothetical protein